MANRNNSAPPDETSERTLPHNLEAERAVLGAILMHNDAADDLEELQSPDFFRDAHRRLYESMLRLREDGSVIDLITLKADLARRGDLDQCGGPAYIAALVDGVPRRANVSHHAAVIIEHARRREAIFTANKLATRAYEADEKPADIANEAAERLLALCERTEAGRAVPISEIVPGGLHAIRQAAASGSIVTGLASQYTDLDEMTTGFHPADLVVVAARTSVGKTAFALSVARNVAARCGPGEAVQVHSLEMPKEQLFLRLLAAETKIEVRRLRGGMLSKQEWERVAAASEVIAPLPIYIDDTPSVTCKDVLARNRSLHTQGVHPVLLVIDYLQLMRGHGKFDNRTQEVGTVSRGSKAMAKRLGIPVIQTAQLSRAPEQRRGNRPQLSDLRESGEIEQDADMVLFLFRPGDEDSQNLAEVIIGKQRNGPLGVVKLAFFDYCTRFENLSYRTDVPA